MSPWRERRPESALFLLPLVVLLLGAIRHEAWGEAAAWIAAAAWPLSLAFRVSRKQDEAGRRYDGVRREFESGDGHFVSLIVRQGDAPTGEDVGLLWVEGGRLYFSGRLTSFGLVPAQAAGGPGGGAGLAGLRHEVEIPLRHRTPAGPMAVSFRPILLPRERSEGPSDALWQTLEGWSRGKSGGEGQLPPTSLAPGAVSEARLLGVALAITLPGAAALACAAIRQLSIPMEIALLASLLFFVGVFPASSLRWRALRDRRRLRRVS